MTESRRARVRGRIGKIEIAVFAIFAIVGLAIWFFAFRETTRINVILISIDTLRANHVSCYGYQPPSGANTTPNLDSLAARGVRFEEAHSTTSWTLPSHLALMTGLPNQLHGVRIDYVELDSNRKMLAERLTEAGYHCEGYYGGPYLHPTYGFGRGFARYQAYPGAPFAQNDPKTANDPNALFRTEKESHRAQTAEPLTKLCLDFLERQRTAEKPFFLFLHHWDAHFDYVAPERFVRKFAPNHDVMKERLSMRDFISNEQIHKDMPADEYAYVLANYDAEIAFVDEQIGRLFSKLEELGLAENTLVVVTSDHGEEFFEHGRKGHRFNLNRESLHIPLIFAGPGVRKNVAIPETVRIFDIAPTILELLGLDADDDEIYGLPLTPFLEGGRVPGPMTDLPIVAELTFIPPKTPDPSNPGTLVDPKDLYHHEAFSKREHKLIEIRTRKFDPKNDPFNLDGEKLKLAPPRMYHYGDGDDPLEQRDLREGKPDVFRKLREEAERLRGGLRDWKTGLKKDGVQKATELSEAMQESLRENGYVGVAGKPIELDEPDFDESEKPKEDGSDGDGAPEEKDKDAPGSPPKSGGK
jgi:arylsulfatase A-like enzyme